MRTLPPIWTGTVPPARLIEDGQIELIGAETYQFAAKAQTSAHLNPLHPDKLD